MNDCVQGGIADTLTKKRDFGGSKWPIALCPLAGVIQLLHNSVKKTVLVNNSILISCVAYRGMVS